MSEDEPNGCSLALAVLALMAGLALSSAMLGGAVADAEQRIEQGVSP